jgi:hypothetical protein
MDKTNSLSLDQKISTKILNLDHNLITTILYPFSSFFHPKLIIIPITTVYLLSNKSIYDTTIYIFGMILTVIVSTILKRFFKR